MSVADVQQIDMMGIDSDDEIITLGVIDYLDWSDELNHLELLQEKLNNYIEYIVDGQAFKYFEGKDFSREYVEINVIFMNEITENCLKLLDYFRQFMDEHKIKLVWEIDSDLNND